MALRGKRKRKKGKAGAMSDIRKTNEGERGQRSRRYGHKNKEGRHTEPGTKQTANNAGRGGGSDNHKRTRKKQCFNNGTSKSLFNNSPVCVEYQHTRVRVGARSVYQERNERKKKTRRARKNERKKKRKEERKKGIKKKEEI